jgi:hypothetical protein
MMKRYGFVVCNQKLRSIAGRNRLTQGPRRAVQCRTPKWEAGLLVHLCLITGIMKKKGRGGQKVRREIIFYTRWLAALPPAITRRAKLFLTGFVMANEAVAAGRGASVLSLSGRRFIAAVSTLRCAEESGGLVKTMSLYSMIRVNDLRLRL